MIEPTKTACYVYGKEGEAHKVLEYWESSIGTVIETDTPDSDFASVWFIDDIERIVVREELK